MIAASVPFFIMFVLSINALLSIPTWYPPLVAGIWLFYDQMLMLFCLAGFLSGLCAASFSLARKKYRWTVVFAVFCTLSGFCAWIISMIIPHAKPFHSLFYYFIPLFAVPLVGTILIILRKEEFDYVASLRNGTLKRR